jgi:hypothetical protein
VFTLARKKIEEMSSEILPIFHKSVAKGVCGVIGGRCPALFSLERQWRASSIVNGCLNENSVPTGIIVIKSGLNVRIKLLITEDIKPEQSKKKGTG